jgi:hypothetical protein
MSRTAKTLALLLTFVVAMSCLTMAVKQVTAQSFPQPTIPKFTLKFVNSSYVESPVSSPDPYTGKNELVQTSNYALNLSVEMTIYNQPFTPYVDSKSNQIVLLYNVEWKPHYSADWNGFGANRSLVASNSWFVGPMSTTLISPNAPTTTYRFGLGQNNATAPLTTGPDYGDGNLGTIPLNGQGQVDFKVEAFIGYATTLETNPLSDPYHRTYEYDALITGPSSGFSNVQTITIPANVPSSSQSSPVPRLSSAPTSTSTPTPSSTSVSSSQPTSFWLVISTISFVVIAILLALISALLLIMKHRKSANLNEI